MLRLLVLIGAVILAVVAVVAVLHFLWWLFTIALVIVAIGLLFGAFRIGRWSSRRR